LCGWDFARSRKGFAARHAPRLQTGHVVCITIERERERVRFLWPKMAQAEALRLVAKLRFRIHNIIHRCE